MTAYTISTDTKNQLERLIDRNRGDTHGYASRGGVRQVIHVKITGPLSSGYYPCLPRAYSPDDDTWTDYDEGLCFDANDRPLSEDQTYLAVRYGVGPDSKLVFATATGGGFEFVEVTGGGGGVYSGNGVSVVSGSWASNGLTYSTIYRAPSADYDEPTLPEIPPGQVVLVRPSPTEADSWEMTAWGGQKRVCDKKYLGSYCDAGNIVNVYEYRFIDARDLCVSPAPSDCGAASPPPPPPPPPVTYYDCSGEDCVEVEGPSDYPDDPTCGGDCTSPPPPPPPPPVYYDCDGGDCIEVPGPTAYVDDPTCGGDCTSPPPPPPPPPPVVYYDCVDGSCVEVEGPSDYPDDATCGGGGCEGYFCVRLDTAHGDPDYYAACLATHGYTLGVTVICVAESSTTNLTDYPNYPEVGDEVVAGNTCALGGVYFSGEVLSGPHYDDPTCGGCS